MKISVVIPAFREADWIAATVTAAKKLPGVVEVIVIDDGSPDDTAARAKDAGARVIVRSKNGGKAAALTDGLREISGDAALLLDADLGETASQAGVLIDPISRGDADISIATFPIVPGRGGGMGFVVKTARAAIFRATNVTLSAPLSGQRCLRRDVIKHILPLAPGFGVEVGMSIDALQAGFKIVEVPTQMDHRVTQNDWRGRLHRLRQLHDVVRAIVARGTRLGTRR